MIFATDIALLNNWNIFFIYFLLYIPVLIWLKTIYSFGFLFLSWIGIATFLFMVFCCVPISSGKSRNINQYSCIDKISVRRHNQYFSTCTSKINIWSLLSNVWHKGAEKGKRGDIEESIATAPFVLGISHYLVVYELFSVVFCYLSWFWFHGEPLW